MAATLLSAATAGAVALDVRVREDEWKGLYDRLEIHRSAYGDGGPYEELTDVGYASAQLPVTAAAAPTGAAPVREYSLTGKTLVFRVARSTEVTITFSGTDPVTNTGAANQILMLGAPYLRSYVDAKGQVVVATMQQGAAAFLECRGGTAAPHLGFQSTGPGSLISGRDPRLPLAVGRERYVFLDPYSAPDYVYKTRFVSSLSGATSPFSDPIPATCVAAVPSEMLALGYVRLVSPSGRPMAGHLVTVCHDFLGLAAQEYTVAGAEQAVRTDATGYAEVTLLRGLSVDVAIEGTPLARRVIVPSDPAVLRFNLLDPSVGSDDLFTVRKQGVPYAGRTLGR